MIPITAGQKKMHHFNFMHTSSPIKIQNRGFSNHFYNHPRPFAHYSQPQYQRCLNPLVGDPRAYTWPHILVHYCKGTPTRLEALCCHEQPAGQCHATTTLLIPTLPINHFPAPLRDKDRPEQSTLTLDRVTWASGIYWRSACHGAESSLAKTKVSVFIIAACFGLLIVRLRGRRVSILGVDDSLILRELSPGCHFALPRGAGVSCVHIMLLLNLILITIQAWNRVGAWRTGRSAFTERCKTLRIETCQEYSQQALHKKGAPHKVTALKKLAHRTKSTR